MRLLCFLEPRVAALVRRTGGPSIPGSGFLRRALPSSVNASNTGWRDCHARLESVVERRSRTWGRSSGGTLPSEVVTCTRRPWLCWGLHIQRSTAPVTSKWTEPALAVFTHLESSSFSSGFDSPLTPGLTMSYTSTLCFSLWSLLSALPWGGCRTLSLLSTSSAAFSASVSGTLTLKASRNLWWPLNLLSMALSATINSIFINNEFDKLRFREWLRYIRGKRCEKNIFDRDNIIHTTTMVIYLNLNQR